MEEADILGDKIAIMKDGYLAAVGTNLRLKNKFGTGYSVTILSDAERTQDVRNFVEQEFAERMANDANKKKSILDGVEEEQFSLMSEMPGVLEYKIPSRYADTMSNFFEDIEGRRKEFGIHDVQLSLTTLEDVRLGGKKKKYSALNMSKFRFSCVSLIKTNSKKSRSASQSPILPLNLPYLAWQWPWCWQLPSL